MTSYDKTAARIGDVLIIEFTDNSMGKFRVNEIHPPGSFGVDPAAGEIVMAVKFDAPAEQVGGTDLNWRYITAIHLIEQGPEVPDLTEQVNAAINEIIAASRERRDSLTEVSHDHRRAEAALDRVRKAREAIHALVQENAI